MAQEGLAACGVQGAAATRRALLARRPWTGIPAHPSKSERLLGRWWARRKIFVGSRYGGEFFRRGDPNMFTNPQEGLEATAATEA